MGFLNRLIGATTPDHATIWLDATTDTTYTLEDLRAHVTRISSLCELVPQDHVIAVDTSTSAWLALATILGVMSANRAAMPIPSPDTDALRDLGVAALITPATSHDAHIELLTTSSASAPAPIRHDASLVLHTSGSSGSPRHVMLSSDGILANVDAILSYLPLAPDARVGLLTPLHYSYGLIGQCMTALRAGACVVDLGRGPWIARQLEHMRTANVTLLSAVPSILRSILGALDDTHDLNLEHIASAGAPLPEALVRALHARFPDATLYNQYGMTEASPRLCAGLVTPETYRPGFVGQPLPGIELEIDHDGSSPTGPIIARTPSVMLGYWQDPDATAAILTARGLRTGDIGSLDADGALVISGREDDLIKVGGERVSLVGVRHRVLDIRGVEQCAVVASHSDAFGTRLTAFIVSSHDERSLRRSLRASLPPAMRPHTIHLVDALPIGSTGKLDRTKLDALSTELAG